MAMKIDAIKNKYKDQWVLVDVTEEDRLNRPVRGTVLTRSRNRDKIYEEIKKLPKGFKVATIFTGKKPPHDTAFVF